MCLCAIRYVIRKNCLLKVWLAQLRCNCYGQRYTALAIPLQSI